MQQAPADDTVDQQVKQIERDEREERVGPRREQVVAHPGDGPLHARRRRAVRSLGRGHVARHGGCCVRHGLPLHQRHARIEPVHPEGRGEADGQEHAHGDEDHFDRLSGLVQDGAREHAHEIRVADGHGERGVFGEVQILARQRRDDDAHGLRDGDEPQRLAAAEAQGIGCLRLPLGHAHQARAHRLGDKARGIER